MAVTEITDADYEAGFDGAEDFRDGKAKLIGLSSNHFHLYFMADRSGVLSSIDFCEEKWFLKRDIPSAAVAEAILRQLADDFIEEVEKHQPTSPEQVGAILWRLDFEAM